MTPMNAMNPSTQAQGPSYEGHQFCALSKMATHAIDTGDAQAFTSVVNLLDQESRKAGKGPWDMIMPGFHDPSAQRHAVIRIVSHIDPLPCHFEMVRSLVDRGLDLNALPEGSFHETPMTIAVRRSSPSMLKTLLDLGADPNGVMQVGADKFPEWTPLRCLLTDSSPTAEKGNTPLKLQYLLEAGADMELASKLSKDSPLFMALASGRWSSVKALMDLGHDVNMCWNTDRVSALNHAKVFRPELFTHMKSWLDARRASSAIDKIMQSANKRVPSP